MTNFLFLLLGIFCLFYLAVRNELELDFINVILVLTIWLFFTYTGCSKFSQKNIIYKSRIIKIFNDTKWKSQSFNYNGTLLTDSDGNTHFYPVKDMDNLVERLNKELNK